MEKFQGEISWKCSVHLLDGGSARAGTSRGITAETSRHASSGHAATSSCCLVDLRHDRVDDALELLLLALELIFLSQLVLVKPVKSVLHCLFDLFLSSSALNFSASWTMRSISAWDRRPFSLVMVIWFDLPVDLSCADTLRMPLASMSKVTSIWGTPRGAGGMPSRWNLPNKLLSFVMARSPSKTWINTPGWLSA